MRTNNMHPKSRGFDKNNPAWKGGRRIDSKGYAVFVENMTALIIYI